MTASFHTENSAWPAREKRKVSWSTQRRTGLQCGSPSSDLMVASLVRSCRVIELRRRNEVILPFPFPYSPTPSHCGLKNRSFIALNEKAQIKNAIKCRVQRRHAINHEMFFNADQFAFPADFTGTPVIGIKTALAKTSKVCNGRNELIISYEWKRKRRYQRHWPITLRQDEVI